MASRRQGDASGHPGVFATDPLGVAVTAPIYQAGGARDHNIFAVSEEAVKAAAAGVGAGAAGARGIGEAAGAEAAAGAAAGLGAAAALPGSQLWQDAAGGSLRTSVRPTLHHLLLLVLLVLPLLLLPAYG